MNWGLPRSVRAGGGRGRFRNVAADGGDRPIAAIRHGGGIRG